VSNQGIVGVDQTIDFAADVLGTLLSYLEQRAKPMRKPIGPTFLLNNRESGSLSLADDSITYPKHHIRPELRYHRSRCRRHDEQRFQRCEKVSSLLAIAKGKSDNLANISLNG
jgi:hypothetical protein